MFHYLLFLTLLIPAVGGLAMVWVKPRVNSNILFTETLAVTAVCAVLTAVSGTGLAGVIDLGPFAFRLGADRLGEVFSILFAVIFLLAGIFSMEYNSHDQKFGRFNGFFLLTLSCMMGLSYAQNLFTYYFFYEGMTLLSLPLVLHEAKEAARKAAFQYLGYSLFGAALVLFGFFGAGQYCETTDFIPGGSLNVTEAQMPAVLIAAFCLLIGFGCKAGMLPLQQWLPIAHPVAPAPASAVLSATITKAGVLGIIRGGYYIFGMDALAGTWVQKVLLVLALMTVFTGSMLAYKEKLFKRRLAWSTVSQVSYVLYGLFLFTPQAFQGAILQVIFHAVCKTALFLTAGAVIHQSGKTYVYELSGLGRKMPVVFTCFTLSSLSLVGIPPFAGFVSKWNLAVGGITALGPVQGGIGAAVLLVSALLTAGYLFSISIHAFLDEGDWQGRLEPGWKMKLPLILLSGALLVMGIWTGGLSVVLETLTSIF